MTDARLEIRSARLPEDYPAMAAIIAATDPSYRPSPEELEQNDASRDPKLLFAQFIAERVQPEGRAPVGFASVGHDRWNPRQGVFILNIRVLPEHQRRGVGSGLYQHVLDQLAPMNPKELRAYARENQTHSVQFLSRHGFNEFWRRFESKLSTANFDFSAYAELEAAIEARGIRIVTYPQLEADPERDRKLYDLDQNFSDDIPIGEDYNPPSFERWRTDYIETKRAPMDAFFVAVHGADYVGVSTLWTQGENLFVAMTGVHRGYRGFGLATALKLRGIRYAQSRGNLDISTMNDAPNAAMIAVNEKLGYVRSTAWVQYAKTLAENA